MGKKKLSEWEGITQSIQAVYEDELVAGRRRQSLWGKLVATLLGVTGLVSLFYLVPPVQQLDSELVEPIQDEFVLDEPELEKPESSASSTDNIGPALRQEYRARRADYTFTWDVASFEALKSRFSMELDDEGRPISLDEVVAQQGKPSLVEYIDGWVFVFYSEQFAERIGDWGQYSQRVELAFKQENGLWVLQDKTMLYMVTDEIRHVVEGAPYRNHMIEGTNQKAWLKNLVSSLAIGQVGNGKGGASLEETLELLGRPTGYGFWRNSDQLVLIYEDADRLYLSFKRQEDGSYLLSERD